MRAIAYLLTILDLSTEAIGFVLLASNGLLLLPLALDNRSKTALALLKRDTRLAVLFRPPFELAFDEPREGDEVVDPLMLLLLPLLDKLLVISLSLMVFIPCIDDVVVVVAELEFIVEVPLRRSMDMAWRRLASSWRALLVAVEPTVRLRISLIVEAGLLLELVSVLLLLPRLFELAI